MEHEKKVGRMKEGCGTNRAVSRGQKTIKRKLCVLHTITKVKLRAKVV